LLEGNTYLHNLSDISIIGACIVYVSEHKNEIVLPDLTVHIS